MLTKTHQRLLARRERMAAAHLQPNDPEVEPLLIRVPGVYAFGKPARRNSARARSSDASRADLGYSPV